MRRLNTTAAEVSRTSPIKEGLWSKWRTGRELPTEERRAAIATALGVDPDTVPIPTETERADLARYLAQGHLPQPDVSRTPGTYPDTPPKSDPGGKSQEGAIVEDFGEKARGFVNALPSALQPDAMNALVAWMKQTPIHYGADPPQPAARRSESRRRKRR